MEIAKSGLGAEWGGEWGQGSRTGTRGAPQISLVPEPVWSFLLQMRRRLEEGVSEFYYAPQAFGFALPPEDPTQEFVPALLRDAEDAGFEADELAALRLYLPIVVGGHYARRAGRVFVVAHLAQSLDGRIATHTGHSRWISNSANLLHVHRMRALVDAVLVGHGTAAKDRPQLTVRHVAGRNPARIVIAGRCTGRAELLTGSTEDDLLLHGQDPCGIPGHAALGGDSGVDPEAALSRLAERGWHSLLIEGGGGTVSRFLSRGAWDRLQLHIAPLVLGGGVPALDLPLVDAVDDAPRVEMQAFDLDGEILIECRRRSSWRFN
ncbi:MAG: RibD family protein [Bdellovibrionales bacterium]|nr:RibD family protein [Bdellovibrionales bacterium]